MPRMPCSTLAMVLTRPASGMVNSTWAKAFAALNTLNAATKKMVGLMRLAFRSIARWDLVESPSRSRFLIEHDLFGKPLHTFPDHALGPGQVVSLPKPVGELVGQVAPLLRVSNSARCRQDRQHRAPMGRAVD